MDSSDGKELYLSYEFKLLLRGSRNGFALCDDQSKTVIFVKVKGRIRKILGRYNPLIWNKPKGYGWIAYEYFPLEVIIMNFLLMQFLVI